MTELLSTWSENMTKCKSCNEKYAADATYYGFPKLNDGTNSLDPWPLCKDHALPHALIAGWKPLLIDEALQVKKFRYRVKSLTERV